jgi:hypothetical protein
MQCDFANKVLGGGVLGRGCVQEEIRFAVCPELMLSRLLAEALQPHEALIMNGSCQYSSYSGYGTTFAFAGPASIPNLSPAEVSKQMRHVCVVAMDAVDFARNPSLRLEYQFLPFWISREVIKAYAAFVGAESQLEASKSGPIATGNWGCGAFGGDLYLKFLIQWCAASAAGRPLVYHTFGNPVLAESIRALVTNLLHSQRRPRCPAGVPTAGQLFQALMVCPAPGGITTLPPLPDSDELLDQPTNSVPQSGELLSSFFTVDDVDGTDAGDGVAMDAAPLRRESSSACLTQPPLFDAITRALMPSEGQQRSPAFR